MECNIRLLLIAMTNLDSGNASQKYANATIV